MQQKPTAYVRPMDGQDQASFESLELKPLLEEYHEGPNEDVSDLKAKVKAELSKLETLSEPKEESDEDLSDLKAKAKVELSKFETPSEPIEVSAIFGDVCWSRVSLAVGEQQWLPEAGMTVCVWKVHFEVDLGVRYLFEWSKCDTSCDLSVVFSVRLQQVL